MRLGKKERLALKAEKARYKRVPKSVHIRNSWDRLEAFQMGRTSAKRDWAGRNSYRD